MNPSEGRVPVSWNECADWLDAGLEVWREREIGWGATGISAPDFRDMHTQGASSELRQYRLLPPPGLVAAPESMDGGGWLGQGKDVPDGWKWRHMTDSGWLQSLRPTFGDAVVQCRPPVRARDVVEVPLTRLVGRTIEHCEKPVKWRSVSGDGRDMWSPDTRDNWHFFPAGTLDLDTGLVRVYAEGDEK